MSRRSEPQLAVGVAAAVVGSCLLAASAPALAMDWREDTFPAGDGKAVKYVVVTSPKSAASLRVMVPSKAYVVMQRAPANANASSLGTPLASLEAATSTAYVASLPAGPVAVLSGAYSTNDPSRPAGLVIANGEVVKQLNLALAKPRAAASAPVAAPVCPTPSKYKWSGLLCVGSAGLTIGATERMEAGDFAEVEKCHDALQSFPLIVEPGGSNGICSDEPARQAAAGPQPRAVVCTTDTEVKLIVTQATYLYPLAQHLIRAEKCVTALNLSGSVQAGVGYRAAGSSTWTWWPRGDAPRTPLSSVIVVSERASLPMSASTKGK